MSNNYNFLSTGFIAGLKARLQNKGLLFFLFAFFSVISAKAQVDVISTGGTAPSASYTTLKAAFDAINPGILHTGIITIGISANTTETATAVLNASGTGGASYTAITISPTGGAARTISGAITAGSPLIDLNGADNVTINGLNTGGNALTISNTTASATSGTSTIRFQTDATSNTITNCSILGSATMAVGTSGGNIWFGSAAVSTGNDNNTISNCNIGPAGVNLPSKCIFFSGTSNTNPGTSNSGNVINNNNIFDYFSATVSSAGIDLTSGTATATITNNRFYQTATRTQTSTALSHRAISLNNSSGDNYTVTGNIIGYNSNLGTGTYTFVFPTTTSGSFIPIFASLNTANASNISSNTITNIAISGGASGTSSSAPFRGIYVASGLATCNSNTIGSQSATGAITFTSSSSSAADVIGMFNFGSSAWTTNNNTVGGITASNSSTGAANIYGLRANTSSLVTWTATGNTIGGTIANSINSTSTATGTIVNGILNSSPAGTITGNTIRNMNVAGGTGTTTTASMVGIVVNASSANHTVGSNTIFNLSNSNATAATVVTGIQFNGSTANIVEKNYIYGLTTATNSATSEINGIRVAGGTTTYRNNMIALGAGISNSPAINGFLEFLGTNTIWHNSIYLGGTATAGSTASTAFNGQQTTNNRSFRNNIFVNNRTNSGGTAKHYIVRVGGSGLNPTGLTINNNIYFGNGTGNVFGLYNSVDIVDLAAWKAAVGQDAASFSSNPQFVDPTNAIPDLHINPSIVTAAEGNGVDLGVTDDFDGQTRASLTPVDIGADAGNFTGADLTAPAISYTALSNTASTTNRTFSAVAITDVTGVNTTAGTKPRLYYKKSTDTNDSSGWKFVEANGTTSPFDFTIDYSLLTAGSVSVGDVIQYFVVAQDTSTPANVGVNSGSFAAPPSSVALAAAQFPIGGTINSFLILNAISGTKTVCASGCDYASLTLAGGAFAAINNSALTGNLTLQISGDLTGETGAIALNEFSGFSVTIKPVGAARSITGSSAGALLGFNAVDNLIIDGQLGTATNPACGPGTASRDLTITNTNTGTSSAVVWLYSNGTNGATGNIVRNCNLVGSGVTQTLIGLGSGGSASVSTSSLGTGNNTNTFENNNISGVQYGIYSQGASAANKNTDNKINQNIFTTSPNAKGGIWTGFENNITISGNSISNIAQTSSPDVFGIAVGMTAISATTSAGNEVTNATVTNNTIGSVVNSGTFSAAGITLAAATSGTNLIANNMISGVSANGTSGDFSAGIILGGGTGSVTNVYHNTVVMQGTISGTTAASQTSACLAVTTSTAPTIDLRNNIFSNTQVGNTGSSNRFAAIALGYSSTLGNYAGLTSNNNNLYAAGTVVGTSTYQVGLTAGVVGTARTTLANWTTETGRDGASQNVAPLFNSSTDLHLVSSGANSLLNGTAIPGLVSNDIDCEARIATPDIGADEFNLQVCDSGALAGGTATPSTARYCITGSPTTISATGYSVGIDTNYEWESSTDNFVTNIVSMGAASTTYANLVISTPITVTTKYRLKVFCSASPGTVAYSSTVATVTIDTPTAITGLSDSTICSGDSVTLTAVNANATSFTWTAPGGYTNSGASISVSPTVTTTYKVTTAYAAPNVCANDATVTITVNPSPSAITVTPTAVTGVLTSNTICAGNIVKLTATGGIVSLLNNTIITESFTSGLGTFTAINSSLGNADQNWTQRPNGFVYSSITFSGSNGGFALANSDSAGTSTSTSTNTRLVSPSFNTTGYTNLTLQFNEYLNNSTDTAAAVEISDDDFTSNIVVLRNDIANDFGSLSTFASTSLPIPAQFQNKSNVKVRFRYEGVWDWYWAIDEVKVIGDFSQSTSITWSSTPPTTLYTNAAATAGNEYVANTSATEVYARPTGTSITYTSTAVNGTCPTSGSTTVTVNALPSVTVAPITICQGTSGQFNAQFPSGASYNYSWVPVGGGTPLTGATPTVNATLSDTFSTTTYNVTATDNTITPSCSNSNIQATVTVNDKGSIISGTTSRLVSAGQPTTFEVVTSGTGLTYQWQVNGTDILAADPNYSGENTPILSVTGITDDFNGYEYQCIVTGASPCLPLTPIVATLTVYATGFTAQPANVNVCGASTASFSIVTSGALPGSTQWQFSDNGVDFYNIGDPLAPPTTLTFTGVNDITSISPTSISSTLQVSGITIAHTGLQFRCVLDDFLNSDPATLTINTPPSIVNNVTTTPFKVCSVTTDTNLSITTAGSVAGVEWKYATSATGPWNALNVSPPTGVTYAGGTTNTLVVTTTSSTSAGDYFYKAFVTGAGSGPGKCADVESAVATISLFKPIVTVPFSSAVYCNPGPSIALSASSTSDPLTYAWFPATDLYTNAAATVGNEYTSGVTAYATPSATRTYTIKGTDTNNCSSEATITITRGTAPIVATASSSAGSSSVCPSADVQLTGVVNSAGFATQTAVSTYNFSQSSDTYTPLTGDISLATQTVPTGTTAAALDDVIYTVALPFDFSFAGVNYASATNLNVSTNGFVTFAAAPATGNYTPISNATSGYSALAPYGRDLNGGYGATGSNTSGSPVLTITTGSTAEFLVGAVVTGSGIPTGATVVSTTATTVTLSANCTTTGSGRTFSVATGRISYKVLGASPNRQLVIQYTNMRPWNVTLINLDFQIVLNETTNVVSFIYGNPIVNTGTTAGTAQVGLRGVANTNFNNRTSTTSWSATTAGATNTATISYSSTIMPASGLTYIFTPAPIPATATFAWSGSDGYSNSGATVTANPTASSVYTLTATATPSGCKAVATVNVGVDATPPAITSTPAPQTICQGATASFTVTATSASPVTYRWRKDGILIPLTNVSAGTATLTLSNTTPADNGSYTVDVIGCSTVTSTSYALTVNPAPTAVTVSGAGTFCSSTSITADNGGSGTIYFQGTTSGGTSTASSDTSPTITSSGTYYFRAQSAAGCWGTEGSAIVVIQTPAGITVTPASSCQNGASTTLAATAATCSGSVTLLTGSLTGTFSASDPIARRPTTSIVNSATCSFDASVTRNYQIATFQVSSTGTYTFDMTGSDDGMGYITTGAFVPGNCLGGGSWIVGDDDSGPGNDPQLIANLVAGTTYTLVTTNYGFSSGTATGTYSWAITAPVGNIVWFTAPSGGTSFGTGSPFNPVGVANSGLQNTNTPGTTTFYAACSSSTTCRTPVTYTIDPLPTASTSGSGTKTISPIGSYTLTPSEATAANGTIAWTVQTGNGFITANSTTEEPTYTPDFLDAGTNVTLLMTVTGNNTCGSATATATYTFSVDPAVSASTTGSGTKTICSNGAYTLVLGEASAENGTIAWTEDGAGSITSGANTLTPTYTAAAGDANTNVTLTLTVSATNGSVTQTATATYVIAVDPLPSASTSGSGSNTICSNSSYTLVSGEATTANGSVAWSHNGNGSLTDANTLTPTYSAVATDGGNDITLTMTVTSTNACAPQTASANYIVHVYPTPTAVAPSDKTYCEGEVNAAIPLTGTPLGVTFNISGGSAIGLDDAFGVTAVPSFTGIAGSAVISITPYANGCPGATVTYNITVQSKYTFYADNDNDGYGGTAVQLCSSSPIVVPPGYYLTNTDCDDTRAAVNPAAVEISFDNLDNDCDGSLYNSHPAYYTDWKRDVCGKDNLEIDKKIECEDFRLSGYVVDFRFRITNLSTGEVNIIDSANRDFRLTETDIYMYGTWYKIEVALIIGGEVQPYNPVPCQIRTKDVKTSEVDKKQCGRTLALLNSNIKLRKVGNTNLYRIRVALASAPTTFYYLERTTPNFDLTMAFTPALPVMYNTEYLVDVQVRVEFRHRRRNQDELFVWSQFGDVCSVITPALPETQITLDQCTFLDTNAVPSNTYVINAIPFPGATTYRFRFTDVNTLQELTLDRSVPNFTLAMVPGLLPNTYYDVDVDMLLFGSWVGYGKACTILTPAVLKASPASVGAVFKATAYPNPFANNFMIDVKSSSQSTVNLKVYDMLGRLVEQRDVNVSDLETTTIGERYPSGVYNVVVSQADSVETVRVVKR